jgi:GTPase
MDSIMDVELFGRNMDEEIIPILSISCKNGTGIEYLKNFLNLITPFSNSSHNLYDNPSFSYNQSKNKDLLVFHIHEHFISCDKNMIVAGFVSNGRIEIGKKYYLGPNKTGNYTIVEVNGIHCKKLPSKFGYKGQFVTVGLSSKCINILNIIYNYYTLEDNIHKETIRKGMVLLDIQIKPYSIKAFECDLISLESSSREIKFKYEPIVYISNVRQCCKITNESKKICGKEEKDDDFYKNFGLSQLLKSSSTSTINTSTCTKIKSCNDGFLLSSEEYRNVRFEFKNFPEYIEIGDKIFINETYMKAFGSISRIYT